MSAPSDSPKDPETGRVIDPAILAERRARREQGEDGGLERVVALEQRLAAAEDEVAAAREREQSGQRLRGELERDASANRRVLEAEIGRLRAEHGAAQARSAELARTLEAAAPPADAGDTAREAGLRHEVSELGGQAEELRGALRAEREAREGAEVAVRAERERAGAELDRLRGELDRRNALQAGVTGQIAELRSALDEVRAGASEAERLGAELATTHAAEAELRARLTDLERDGADSAAQLAQATAEVAAQRAALHELRERLATGVEELRVRREALTAERTARLEAEQTAASVQGRAAALEVELEHERLGRSALEALVVAERGRFADGLEAARETAQAALAHQRVLADARLTEVGLTVDALRAELKAAIGELTARADAEQAARTNAERELVAERSAREDDRSQATVEADRLRALLAAAETALAGAQGLALQERERVALLETERAEGRTVEALELEAVRARVAEAETTRAALEADLARRSGLQVEVVAALAALRDELEGAREQGRVRSEREAAIESLVTELVGTAQDLRTCFDAELGGLRSEHQTERESFAEMLADAEHRIAELQDDLALAARAAQDLADASPVEALVRELEERRAADERAAAELRCTREELERLQASGGASNPIYDTAPAGPQHPAADHPALARRDAMPASDPTPAVVLDLARAAERLRALSAEPEPAAEERRAEVEAAREPAVEAPAVLDPAEALPEGVGEGAELPETGAEDHALPEAPTEEAEAVTSIDDDPESVDGAGDEADVVHEPSLAGPSAVGESRLAAVARVVPTETSWLAPALVALAEVDAATAERLLLAALPVQAAYASRDVTYELELPATGRYLVRVTTGSDVFVTSRDDAPYPPDFRLTGTVEALAPLVGGAAPRRLRDVVVKGRRRRARRLLRSLGSPVGLPELERAGARPRAGDLLALLCLAVPSAAVRGADFGVAYLVRDTMGGTSRTLVRAEPDGGLTAVPGAPEEFRADATVTVGVKDLLAVLGGTATVSVDGDSGAVAILHRWFRDVQGLLG